MPAESATPNAGCCLQMSSTNALSISGVIGGVNLFGAGGSSG